MTFPKENDAIDGVAIIGMAGRFPGANNVDQLWRNLCNGLESIRFFADEELDPSIVPELKNNPNYVKARGIVKDADRFDASFFGISPREAQIMDPQHRIFMEVAWEAFENAGYDPGAYDGLIGVFAGAGFNCYLTNNLLTRPDLIEVVGQHQIEVGNASDYLATRISYNFNLKGPSLSIYTGCSTSLVAVCLGFDSLVNYQCDMALAGGAFLVCPLNSGYLYQEGEMYSPDGHTRPFDAGAQGTVFSSGVGIVVLKRLADAYKDKDHIYAVILGTALNNDGSDKMSFTAPSVDGQAEVIAMAQANADVHPETISYIETHGTATPLGDPIEIAALTKAFQSKTSKKNFCAIGSIKSNIGHLDAAAGVAGLIKTALALYHKQIPASLNFEAPNPKIEFASSPFYVNTSLSEWKENKTPRRAGLSSFGVGGTNSHVILEEAPYREVSGPSRRWQLLFISAKTSPALDRATSNLARHLRDHQDLNLADVAFTLQTGRKAFNHRRMVVCQDLNDASNALETLDPKQVGTGRFEPISRDIVFMFSGQGAQYVNMGLELYKNEPTFREQIDRCSNLLQRQLSFDLRDVLYPGKGDVKETTEKLRQTFITQPALFILEYALAKLWTAWGVRPEAFVGHSIGEYVAACLAGVFSVEDALSLVAARGRLIQELPRGTMMAVFLSEDEIQPFLNEKISLAGINGPHLCVVSGEDEAIEDLEKRLAENKVDCRNLHTSHAFHSQMMDPILDRFRKEVEKVERNQPRIPFVSNVTGTWITPDQATSPDYWTRHLRMTIRFSDCITELLKEPNRVLLEVGPGQTLCTLATHRADKAKEQIVLSSTRHPKEQKSDMAFLLKIVGRLWLAGIEVDWRGFYAHEERHRIPLPAYPFERTRHWVDPGKQAYGASITAPGSTGQQEVSSSFDQAHLEERVEIPHRYAPRDDVEENVAKIWQESLGINPIGIHDNFFDLGGSSLVAVRIFAQIEKIFGRRLPLATLYEAPTIEQLADLLRKEEWKSGWDSLVEIQSGGAKPPLFLVHGAGGNLLLYHKLAYHLGTDQPVYGLQSQGLDGERPFLTKVEDMASRYLNEVLAFKPDGPYLMGGYCLGGAVALEMAQQLLAMGKEVSLLIFMETYNFSNIPDQSFLDNVHYYIQKVEFHLRNFLLLDSNEKCTFIKEKAKVAKDRRKVWYGMLTSKIRKMLHLDSTPSSTLSDLWKINDLAALSYVPKPYPRKIVQFLPKKEYIHHLGPELGWENLAVGGLETYQLPVYPAGMLIEPFVRLLAEKIIACISKASEELHINKT